MGLRRFRELRLPVQMWMTVVRLLGNSSGGSVTIREIGLKVRLWYNPTTRYHYLIARDSVNQDVDNGETAVILYTLRTTV